MLQLLRPLRCSLRSACQASYPLHQAVCRASVAACLRGPRAPCLAPRTVPTAWMSMPARSGACPQPGSMSVTLVQGSPFRWSRLAPGLHPTLPQPVQSLIVGLVTPAGPSCQRVALGGLGCLQPLHQPAVAAAVLAATRVWSGALWGVCIRERPRRVQRPDFCLHQGGGRAGHQCRTAIVVSVLEASAVAVAGLVRLGSPLASERRLASSHLPNRPQLQHGIRSGLAISLGGVTGCGHGGGIAGLWSGWA